MAETKLDKSLTQPPQQISELRDLQQMLKLRSDGGSNASLTDVVFVCIDCESYESAHDKVLEIGVAVLDTKNLKAGEFRSEWARRFKHAHYRIWDYRTLINRRFFRGCEGGFGFGTTQWIKADDAKKVLHRLFCDPTKIEDVANFQLPDTQFIDASRNVVLVGHALKNDLAYLKSLGLSIARDWPSIRRMDTQTVAGGTKQAQIGLHALLYILDLDSTNLHNAGNDAAYTLQALLSIACKDHKEPGSVYASVRAREGRPPPILYNNIKAPHAFAGTVVGGESAKSVKTRDRSPSSEPDDSMRDPKRARTLNGTLVDKPMPNSLGSQARSAATPGQGD